MGAYLLEQLNYSNTNTYLVKSDKGVLLVDTGWAGTFEAFCKAMAKVQVKVCDIDYLFITHYHPDHMGIASDIMELGAKLLVLDRQRDCIHYADKIFEKEGRGDYHSFDDGTLTIYEDSEAEKALEKIGIKGRFIYTPGHSDDSYSLLLDDGSCFVGDLNPLYELELHKGSKIAESWEKILELKPSRLYYGHAKSAALSESEKLAKEPVKSELFSLVKRIMKYIDRGYPLDKICRKTGADNVFVEDVTRMYLTHKNVGVQGILDRIEIKGR